jgi:phosphoadenosine phosphosulfate reductase
MARRRLRRQSWSSRRPVSGWRVRRQVGRPKERRQRRRELRRLEAGISTFAGITLDRLRTEFTPLDAWKQVREAALLFGKGFVMSTSFGIQSAVLLDLVSRTAPGTPVIWVDTGYLPPETYRYAETLRERFDLDLRVYQPEMSAARMEALRGRIWETDDPGLMREYNRIRKVEPMERALKETRATAWLSGIRGEQTTHRAGLETVETQMGIYKIHPLLRWTAEEIEMYFRVYDLPRHPLEERGYKSVGDVHSSGPAERAGKNERATRFRGLDEECGLHRDLGSDRGGNG